MDMRFGKLMTLVGSMFQGKNSEPLQPADFFESIERVEPSDEDLQASLLAKLEAMCGRPAPDLTRKG